MPMMPVAVAASIVGPSGAPGILTVESCIPTILVNGRPIAAMGVTMSTPHGTPPAIHSGFCAMGSAGVWVNGDPLPFQGAEMSCGDVILFGTEAPVFVSVI